MRTLWRILVAAALLSAVAVAVMVIPKRPAPPKPELITIEFYIGGNKFTVTGTPVERFDEPQQRVARKGDRLVRADGEPMEEFLFHTAKKQ